MLPHQAIVSVTWQESYLERKKRPSTIQIGHFFVVFKFSMGLAPNRLHTTTFPVVNWSGCKIEFIISN